MSKTAINTSIIKRRFERISFLVLRQDLNFRDEQSLGNLTEGRRRDLKRLHLPVVEIVVSFTLASSRYSFSTTFSSHLHPPPEAVTLEALAGARRSSSNLSE